MVKRIIYNRRITKSCSRSFREVEAELFRDSMDVIRDEILVCYWKSSRNVERVYYEDYESYLLEWLLKFFFEIVLRFSLISRTRRSKLIAYIL